MSTFCRQLKLLADDGKMRQTDCANTEIFSILFNQSISLSILLLFLNPEWVQNIPEGIDNLAWSKNPEGIVTPGLQSPPVP